MVRRKDQVMGLRAEEPVRPSFRDDRRGVERARKPVLFPEEGGSRLKKKKGVMTREGG